MLAAHYDGVSQQHWVDQPHRIHTTWEEPAKSCEAGSPIVFSAPDTSLDASLIALDAKQIFTR